jgi:hypothetical protein
MGKPIAVEEAFAEWRKDPEYVAAYDALEEEFALAAALIEASRQGAEVSSVRTPRSPWRPLRRISRGRPGRRRDRA